jgi:predicted transcriptional regulator
MEKDTEVITIPEYATRMGYTPLYVRQMLSAQSKAGQIPKLRGVIRMSKFGRSWALEVEKTATPKPKKEGKKKKVS